MFCASTRNPASTRYICVKYRGATLKMKPTRNCRQRAWVRRVPRNHHVPTVDFTDGHLAAKDIACLVLRGGLMAGIDPLDDITDGGR